MNGPSKVYALLTTKCRVFTDPIWVKKKRAVFFIIIYWARCGNRHRKLGAHYFDEGFFT